MVAARGGAKRCIACGRAWNADGEELPEEEAQKLIPKSRASRAKSGNGSSARTGRRTSRAPRTRSA